MTTPRLTICPLHFSFGIVNGEVGKPTYTAEFDHIDEARAQLERFCNEQDAHTYKRGTYTYVSGTREEYGDIALNDHADITTTATRWTYLLVGV